MNSNTHLYCNEILFAKSRKIRLEPLTRTLTVGSARQADTALVATLIKKFETIRFRFSKELTVALQQCSPLQVIRVHDELLSLLQELYGLDKLSIKMYPNFPKQVMDMKEAELYIHALFHYWSHQLPEYEKQPRKPLGDDESSLIEEVGLAQEADLKDIGRQLVAANVAFSVTNKAYLAWFAAEYKETFADWLPAELTNKENIAVIGALMIQHHCREVNAFLDTRIRTATDVLRLAAALSPDGDPSLALPTKYRSFSRRIRKMLLGLLDRVANKDLSLAHEDMLRHRNRWLRLGETLHPFEYSKRFSHAAKVFDLVRNQPDGVRTFNSLTEAWLEQKNIAAAVSLLKQRPGVLARRLDHLLRLSGNPDDYKLVCQALSDTADQLPVALLLQLMNHFMYRNAGQAVRGFLPKGQLAQMYVIDNRLPSLPADVCEEVVRCCQSALRRRFAALPSLGNMYVDDLLTNYPIPAALRSAAKALRTVPRGSVIALPPGNIVRFFLWWREGEINGKPTGRVDIDLSATILNADYQYLDHISFTHLRSVKMNACHSGDIVTAPYGASEFVDIDIAQALQNNARYVVMQIHSYTEHSYCDLPECFAGWMIRKQPNSGEIYEVRTVQNRLDLSSDSQIVIPIIINLQDRTVRWTDLSLKNHPKFYNVLEANLSSTSLLVRAMNTMKKPTLHQLFTLHAEARGTGFVSDRGEADTVFAVDQGITPYDIDRIVADFV